VREAAIRVVAGAIVIVVETEAPLRVLMVGTPAEEEALAAWLEDHPGLAGLILRAVSLQDRERAEAWRDELARPPGVSALVEDLVRRIAE
jgi:hypothetical protein